MKTKLFIACHKPTKKLEGELFQYVLGGASLNEKKEVSLRFAENCERRADFWKNVLLDNEGENISNKNETYNELTVIYWLWKNIYKFKEIDNIGFCHYRRHFVLNPTLKPKEDRWTVDFLTFSDQKQYLNKIGLTNAKLDEILSSYTAIGAAITLPFTVRQHYQLSEKNDNHVYRDLLLVEEIVKEEFPDFSPCLEDYLDSKTHYYGNCFIFPKEIFCAYAKLIFGILEKFEKKVDLRERSMYSRRFFISERVTGAFFLMLEKQGKNIKKVPLSYLESIDEFESPRPHFGKDQNTVCFASDENYLPYLSVALRSLVDNLKEPDTKYEFFVLHKALPNGKIRRFLENFKELDDSRFKISFVDISSVISEDQANFYIEIHVTEATYYRFYIQKIFCNFTKILYLDSDLIILEDIGHLFAEQSNKPLSVCLDVRENMAYALELKVSTNVNWKTYLNQKLNLKEGEYFQAGVILFNLDSLRETDLYAECKLALDVIKKPILSDQDVLNKVFKGKVSFIDPAWNVEWQIPLEFGNLERSIPVRYYKIYKDIYESPKIVHYASSLKPWFLPDAPLSYLWWEKAKLTNYFPTFIQQLARRSESRRKVSLIKILKDKVLPLGTRRRRLVKNAYYAARRLIHYE